MDRSDFQASMLYYAGGTYLASALIGDGGLGIQELVRTANDSFGQFVPASFAGGQELPETAKDLPEVPKDLKQLSDELPEVKESLSQLEGKGLVAQGLAVLASGGWAVGALGAALLRRLQALGLAVLALVSGDAASAAYMQQAAVDSSQHAAHMLQGITFATSAAGLSAMAKNGAGRLIPRRLKRGLKFSV